jgi:hypothetical protein
LFPKIYTIPQKLSGTGTIYDLASDQMSREIMFNDNAQFAIVLAAYYGHGENIYFLANDEEEAVEISDRESDYSHAIIDLDGNHYEIYGNKLRQIKN